MSLQCICDRVSEYREITLVIVRLSYGDRCRVQRRLRRSARGGGKVGAWHSPVAFT
jgi:hypothetical protein